MLAVFAQDPKTVDVKGALTSDKVLIFHGYVAELNDLVHPGESVHTDVATDGQFTFRGIANGDYVLRITDYYGTALTEQFVTVRENPSQIEVKLPKGDGARPASGRVSLRQLQHPPAHKAVDAALAGQRFAASGKYDRAAIELRKAIRISPEFAEAHSNLAVQYIRLHQYQEAKSEIEQALAIAGPNSPDLCNMAFVRAALQQFDEGTASAREALRIDPNNVNAHYILGTLLLLHNETRAEGVEHLRRAAEKIESARAALERLSTGTH
jgi:Tfp pilus assembly protein PilF